MWRGDMFLFPILSVDMVKSILVNSWLSQRRFADTRLPGLMNADLTLDGFVVPSNPRHQDYDGDLAMGDDVRYAQCSTVASITSNRVTDDL